VHARETPYVCPARLDPGACLAAGGCGRTALFKRSCTWSALEGNVFHCSPFPLHIPLPPHPPPKPPLGPGACWSLSTLHARPSSWSGSTTSGPRVHPSPVSWHPHSCPTSSQHQTEQVGHEGVDGSLRAANHVCGSWAAHPAAVGAGGVSKPSFTCRQLGVFLTAPSLLPRTFLTSPNFVLESGMALGGSFV
jgi:hypothetical protein